MDFRSDNVAGMAPEILAAIQAANQGNASSYGADEYSAQLDAAFSKLFDTPCRVFPVATGTAANALALDALSPGHGAIYCHEQSHIAVDECNAVEFFTAGARLVPLPGGGGKIDPQALQAHLAQGWRGVQHHPQPRAISIAQATECGTVYAPAEIAALSAIARQHGLLLHMDGARFANAVAAGNHHAADLSWRAGVDVLGFGATKNGALAAEAVIFFKPELADAFIYRRKRGGHLFSKMRFLSAQLLAMLEDGLWLRLAGNANARAKQLADGLAGQGLHIAYPVEANEVFVYLPDRQVQGLKAHGALFHPWDEAAGLYRFVCGFDKSDADVAALLRAASDA